MSRFLLALRCFFAVLFYFRLPRDAVRLLPPKELSPPSEAGEEAEAPASKAPAPAKAAAKATAAPAKSEEREPSPAPVVPAAPAPVITATPIVVPGGAAQPVMGLVVPVPAEPAPASATEPAQSEAALRRRGAVQMLALLQREGRLIDFLMEELDQLGDAQIGSAVRDIHRGCRKGLLEHVKVSPVRPEPDEAAVRIEEGYDPSAVRLIGNITGRPPFHGTLRHHGWRAKDVLLPDLPRSHDPQVITPAEVELGG